MKLKHGTAAAWTAANPVLLDGEPGVEDPATAGQPAKLKIGDGTTAWNALPYQGSASWNGSQVPKGFVGIGHPGLPNNISLTFSTALQPKGLRVRMPISGTLSSLYINVGTSAGNWLGGVYDTGDSSANNGQRNRLWMGSSVASALGWLKLGAPALAVTQDQWLDFVVANDAATAVIKQYATNAVSSVLPSDLWPTTPGGALAKLGFTLATQATLTLPASVIEASVNVAAAVPGIFGLIT